MRKSTSIFKAVLIALFAVSLGVEMVSAAGFPSVKDLYGRYKFSGECSYVDMVSGVAGEAPVPATTVYNGNEFNGCSGCGIYRRDCCL